LIVDCPEATIDLPIDVWVCKRTGQPCPINAVINTDDWANFESYCNAPEQYKRGVPIAVEKKGAIRHHRAGRFLCPLCKPGNRGRGSDWTRCYHDREKLSFIWDHLPPDVDQYIVRRTLTIRDIGPASYNALCPVCLQRVLNELLAALGHVDGQPEATT
jgi:hypothetical protein